MNRFKFTSCWAALLMLLSGAAEIHAQKLQWTDVVYVPGRWQAGKIVAPSGNDTLAVVMRVDYFAQAPRWRAELRRTSDGQSFGEPLVVLGEKNKALVLTPVGTTPVEQHAIGKDALILAALKFDASGARIGAAKGLIRDGSRVIFRRSAREVNFESAALDPGKPSSNKQIISRGLASVGNQRSATVVATAGARGVDKVKTARGEVSVTPDPDAVLKMERASVNEVVLEEFMRAGKLGPYQEGSR